MTRQISGMLVPWIAVLVFWTWLHSAWATIIAYHSLILLFSWSEMKHVARGWNLRMFLVFAMPCVLAGPLTWLLLPVMTGVPIRSWLSSYGLEGAALLLMVPYYGLIHPFIEQAHWSKLRRHSKLGLPASMMFAGYHGLVLSTLMRPVWVVVCVVVLSGTSITWRWMEERKTGGLLVPALTQVLADAGMILAALMRAS